MSEKSKLESREAETPLDDSIEKLVSQYIMAYDQAEEARRAAALAGAALNSVKSELERTILARAVLLDTTMDRHDVSTEISRMERRAKSGEPLWA